MGIIYYKNVTVKEAEEWFGVSNDTIRNWLSRHLLLQAKGNIRKRPIRIAIPHIDLSDIAGSVNNCERLLRELKNKSAYFDISGYRLVLEELRKYDRHKCGYEAGMQARKVAIILLLMHNDSSDSKEYVPEAMIEVISKSFKIALKEHLDPHPVYKSQSHFLELCWENRNPIKIMSPEKLILKAIAPLLPHLIYDNTLQIENEIDILWEKRDELDFFHLLMLNLQLTRTISSMLESESKKAKLERLCRLFLSRKKIYTPFNESILIFICALSINKTARNQQPRPTNIIYKDALRQAKSVYSLLLSKQAKSGSKKIAELLINLVAPCVKEVMAAYFKRGRSLLWITGPQTKYSTIISRIFRMDVKLKRLYEKTKIRFIRGDMDTQYKTEVDVKDIEDFSAVGQNHSGDGSYNTHFEDARDFKFSKDDKDEDEAVELYVQWELCAKVLPFERTRVPLDKELQVFIEKGRKYMEIYKEELEIEDYEIKKQSIIDNIHKKYDHIYYKIKTLNQLSIRDSGALLEQ